MSDVSVTLGSTSVSVATGQATPIGTLQGVWDGSSSANKNTFVDANKTEVLTFVDAFTWAEMVTQHGRGYNYPRPTGQTTVYRTGDDADIEATIFAPVRIANSLKVQNSLVNILTLGNTNSFGNTNRFTDVDGLQVYGDNYYIDHYTGLGWYSLTSNSNWDNGIDTALSSSQNSFTDWFMPNRFQLESLRDDQSTNTYGFMVIPNAATWTSTTSLTSTTAIVSFTQHRMLQDTKTVTYKLALCRKHF